MHSSELHLVMETCYLIWRMYVCVLVSLMLSLLHSTHSSYQVYTCCCQYLSLLCGGSRIFLFFFFTHHLYQSVHLKSLPRDKSWQMQIIQTFMCCNTFVVELNGKYKLNGVFKKNITCFYSFNLMLVCCILVFASTLCVCKRYIHSSRGQYDRWLWSSV